MAAPPLFRGAEHEAYRRGQPVPVRALALQLAPARAGQVVELGVASRLARLPLGLEPAAGFEPVQRGIERPLLDLQDVLRHLLEPLRDGVAVKRTERNDLQDEQVECSLE